MKRSFTFLIAASLAATFLLSSSAHAQQDLYPDHPPTAGLVNDFAGVLSPEQKNSLEQELRALEHDKQVEFAVVTVPSLKGREIEDYANGLARYWEIGKKGADNGVLFLTSPSDHRQRIEVGTRLETVLTDSDSKMILLDNYHPHAVAKDIAGAVMATAQAIDQHLRQKLTTTENATILSHETPKSDRAILFAIVTAAVLLFIFLLGVMFFRRESESEDEEAAAFHRDIDEPITRPVRAGSSESDLIAGAAVGAIIASGHRHEEPREEEPPQREEVSPVRSSYSDSDDEPSSSSSSNDDGFSFGGADGGGFSGGGASGND